MRRRTALALAPTLLIAVGATGCSSSGGSDDPAPAALGKTVTQELAADGAKAAYTVTKVEGVQPTPKNEQFLSAGTRWVGIWLRFENVGSTPVQERPLLHTRLFSQDEADYQLSQNPMNNPVLQGPSLPETVRLKPGEKAEGYVVISIPTQSTHAKRVTVTKVQYTATVKGMRNGPMQWKVEGSGA